MKYRTEKYPSGGIDFINDSLIAVYVNSSMKSVVSFNSHRHNNYKYICMLLRVLETYKNKNEI